METTRTFVRAVQDFFSAPPHGRKVEIPEFKALSIQDKIELSAMLSEAGVKHIPYTGPAAESA
jgi:hypothetical protein